MLDGAILDISRSARDIVEKRPSMAVFLRRHTVGAPSHPNSVAATNSSQGDEFASPSVDLFGLAFSLREKVSLSFYNLPVAGKQV